MSTNKAIQNLHEAYARLSGLPVRLDATRERDWYDFQQAGFTLDDLMVVLKFLRKQIGAGKLELNSLKFSNVLDAHGQNGTPFGRFEENLGMAKHASRERAPERAFTRTLRTGETSAHQVIDHETPAAVEDPQHVRDLAKAEAARFREKMKGTKL